MQPNTALYYLDQDKVLQYCFHPGQVHAWESQARFVSQPVRRFEFSPSGLDALFGTRFPHAPTTVFFGHATDPDGLESATYKAAPFAHPPKTSSKACAQFVPGLYSLASDHRSLYTVYHMGTLYLVATPIGNLEDITARALRVLREVDWILAEDTRHTGKLLKHYQITTPQISYFEHNKLARLESILSKLIEGDLALVSDAGTPALNDPGYELVCAALQAGHQVSPVPGPSAPVAALVASGLPTDRFLYLGYLRRKSSDRRRQLAEIQQLPYTLVFLETPHRLLAALADLISVFGDRQMAVARELTKLHEQIYRGTIAAAAAHFEIHPPRGEITLVIEGAPQDALQWPLEQLQNALQDGLVRGESPSRLAREISAQSGWKRRQVYRIVTEIDKNRSDE